MKTPSRSPKTPGRPRKYPAHLARDGAPHLTVRLAPEQLERVKELGGSPWVRSLIEKALADRELEVSLAQALNALTPPPTAPPPPPQKKTRASSSTASGPPPGPKKTRPKKTRVHLWLQVENGSPFVRGRRKAREEIEQLVLAPYLVEKPDPQGSDYLLSIPNTGEQHLEEILHSLHDQAQNLARSRRCVMTYEAFPEEHPNRCWF